MKEAILKSFDVKFSSLTKSGVLCYSTVTDLSPKKKFSIKYSFWNSDHNSIKRDLEKELSKDKKLMKGLQESALIELKDSRKQKYIELEQGQVLAGKHVIKVMFGFENIKYEVKKIKVKKERLFNFYKKYSALKEKIRGLK